MCCALLSAHANRTDWCLQSDGMSSGRLPSSTRWPARASGTPTWPGPCRLGPCSRRGAMPALCRQHHRPGDCAWSISSVGSRARNWRRSGSSARVASSLRRQIFAPHSRCFGRWSHNSDRPRPDQTVDASVGGRIIMTALGLIRQAEQPYMVQRCPRQNKKGPFYNSLASAR